MDLEKGMGFLNSGFLLCILESNANRNWMDNSPLTIINIDLLHFCLEYRLVEVCGQEIELTAKEFDILALLILNPCCVFTYEMIADIVWKEDYNEYSHKAINNHISNLRKKLKVTPDIPNYIKSVHKRENDRNSTLFLFGLED